MGGGRSAEKKTSFASRQWGIYHISTKTPFPLPSKHHKPNPTSHLPQTAGL